MSPNANTLDIITMIAPKFTSGASILGSSMIISQVMRSKKNRENITQRLICFASISDLMVSTSWFLTNLMMPKFGSSLDRFYIGNMTSCRVQGFIIQLSLAGMMCNSVFISFNHLLGMKYNWGDFKLRKIEPWYYVISLVLGLTVAIIAASKDLFHPAVWDCWIECERSLSQTECEGTGIRQYQMILYICFLWIFIIISAVNSVLLYFHVVKIEEAASKWKSKLTISDRGISESHADTCKHSRAVLIQSVLYVGGFVINWIFPCMYRILVLVSGGKIRPKWLALLAGIFVPSQGFLNAIVFFRVRALKCRSEYPERTWITIICNLVASTLLCTDPYVNDSKDIIKKPKEFEKNVATLGGLALLREGGGLTQDPVSLEEE